MIVGELIKELEKYDCETEIYIDIKDPDDWTEGISVDIENVVRDGLGDIRLSDY